MKLARTIVRIIRKNSYTVESPARLTKTDAVAYVWELTREVFALSGKFDVESGLQRHIIHIARKAG